jgi:GT2 family glycosyltransferase
MVLANYKSAPLVSILILLYNREKQIAKSIESAVNQSYSNIQIVVVDNSSTDGSFNIVKENYPSIAIYSLDKNYGCPGGRNRGIAFCNGDYIFHLDDDGILDVNAITNAMRTMLIDADIGIVTGRVVDINKYDKNEVFIESNIKKEVGIFQGGVSLHRKKIYSDVGFYPDDFFYGGEESFLSYRLLDSGFKIFKDESVILFHPINSIMNKSDFHKRSFENVFVTAYSLFPIFFFGIFIFYFVIFYFFYSLKYGFASDFLLIFNNSIKRSKTTKRYPIKLATIFKFRSLNKN